MNRPDFAVGWDKPRAASPERNWAAEQYLRRRRGRRQRLSPELRAKPEHAFSQKNLFRAFRELATSHGQAAGPDGVSPRDISPAEAGAISDVLSRHLLAGNYRAGETRDFRIPKARPGEYRQLSIPLVVDRAVALVVNDALVPRFDRQFLRTSYGFRRGIGTWDLLADLAAFIGETDAQYILCPVCGQPCVAVHGSRRGA